MIFGGGRKYKLPKFPDNIRSTFETYCEALSEEDIFQVRTELEECMEKLHRLSDRNELVDLSMADQIKQRCDYLLDRYPEYSSEHRALVIGAIRYFAIIEDPLPDSGFSTGLYDDAMVMNYVLEELGEDTMYIEV